METGQRFSEEKLEFLKKIFSGCRSQKKEAQKPLAVIINKGGVLFELPFSEERIYQAREQLKAESVIVFILLESALHLSEHKAIWLEFNQNKVFRGKMEFSKGKLREPFIKNHIHLFASSPLLSCLEIPEKPLVTKCPRCCSAKTELTEILIKREDKLAQVSSKAGVYEGKLPPSFESRTPVVSLGLQGECVHSWYEIFRFSANHPIFYNCDVYIEKDIQPKTVI